MTAARQRDLSLDSFRGADVLLMILVNLQGSQDAAFAMLKHAPWDGLTFADLVFPVFLLIVGLSVPLALDRPGAVISWRAILRRGALLFAIGVALGWLIRPTLDPDMIRWTGVLQRIAIVYLVCAAVVMARRGTRLAIILAVFLLVVHSAMILSVGTPGSGPSLAPGQGVSGWLDQTLLPGRILRTSWDPEGMLSTIPAIANGLIGVAIMRWMLARKLTNGGVIALGIALLIAGVVASFAVPINKNLWTASFALTTCGIGVLAWAAIRQVWRWLGHGVVAQWTVALGQAALTLYIVHTLLIAVIVRKLPDGETIWSKLYQGLAATGLDRAFVSLLFALVATALCCALMPPLKRRGWVLKL